METNTTTKYREYNMLTNFTLANITSAQGIKITPGGTVSGAGDVNGDGFYDILINKYSIIYMVWGNYNLQNMDLNTLAPSQGVKITGQYMKYSASAGDVNGDGFDDTIIGVPGGGNMVTGLVYVIFGKNSGWTNINIENFNSSYGIKMTGGTIGEEVGSIVSGLGDINQDGYDDIFVGTSGSYGYVVFGQQYWQNIDFGNYDSGQIIKVSTVGLINSVAGIKDVNGDGIDDLLIDDLGGDDVPEMTHLIFGYSGRWQDFNLATFNSIVFTAAPESGKAGWNLGRAGNINGNGFGGFVIGVTNDKVYIFYGKDSTSWHNVNLTNFNSSLGFTITDAYSGKYSGFGTYAGDINGDGFGDIVVGLEYSPTVAWDYIILGNVTLNNLILENLQPSSTQDIIISGAGLSEARYVGDVNKDGYDDLLISNPDTAYLLWGGEIETPSPTISPAHPTPLPNKPTTHHPTHSPTHPTLPTTMSPTTDHPTTTPTEHHDPSNSDSWFSTPAGVATLSVGSFVLVGLMGLGTWYYCSGYKTCDGGVSFEPLEESQ